MVGSFSCHGGCLARKISGTTQTRKENMKKNTALAVVFALSTLLVLTGILRAAPPPSAADVGDPDSFGRNAHFMGDASGFITLSPACTPAPTPVPPATADDTQCFTL